MQQSRRSPVLWSMSCRRLRATASHCCHGDEIVEAFEQSFPEVCEDRPHQKRRMSSLSSENRLVCGTKEHLKRAQDARGMVSRRFSALCTQPRELCEGHSLASPGRWPTNKRCSPSPIWNTISALVVDLSRQAGAPEVLMQVAVAELNRRIEDAATLVVSHCETVGRPRSFFRVVRQGCTRRRLPRLPALCTPEKRWRLAARKPLEGCQCPGRPSTKAAGREAHGAEA